MITTSNPANPTAAIVAIAYSAVAEPLSDLINLMFMLLFSDNYTHLAEENEIGG
jgi:hypothetical protein